jgi:hypothetical protein
MNNLITVEGEYIASVDGISESDTYKEEFVFDGSISTKGEARAIAKRLVKPKLLKENPDIKLVQTCQVISMEPTSKKAEQKELTNLWLEAINLSCIPDSIDQYRNEAAKKEALERSIKVARARRAKAGDKAEQDANLGSVVM